MLINRGLCFWFTGLSGAGKTSVAQGVKQRLERLNIKVLIIDGDNIRKQHIRYLGFSAQDIRENNRLIAQLCKEKIGQADIIFASIISPFQDSRQYARKLLNPNFYEIYFSADLSVVKRRDVKGLYAKAMRNEIENLIGFSPGSIYEIPQKPDFIVSSGEDPLEDSIKGLLDFVMSKLEESRPGSFRQSNF